MFARFFLFLLHFFFYESVIRRDFDSWCLPIRRMDRYHKCTRAKAGRNFLRVLFSFFFFMHAYNRVRTIRRFPRLRDPPREIPLLRAEASMAFPLEFNCRAAIVKVHISHSETRGGPSRAAL